jgi:hypothetical protein
LARLPASHRGATPPNLPLDPNACDTGTREPKTCAHVFFMHVPKTGGISLASFLRGMFSPEDICPPSPGDGRWRHRPQDVSHFRFFTGHFSVDFIDALDPAGFKITVLRHPRQRIVSIYDFWRSIDRSWSEQLSDIDEDAPSFAKSVDFATFLRSEKHWVIEGISNTMSRQLLGDRFASIAHDKRRAARAAFDRLTGFDWFTTTEALSEDFASLASAFGVSGPGADRIFLNRTYEPAAYESRQAVTRTVPAMADLRHIDRTNHIDTELYSMAAHYLAERKGRPRRRSMFSELRTLGAAVFFRSGAR